MKRRSQVLIVARPSPLRDGLRALLTTMPQIEIIGQVDDAPSALKMITEQRPAVVVLNPNLAADEVWTVLRGIKAEGTQPRCIVLADNIQQQQVAKAAGADYALLKGFAATRLLRTIESLLSSAEEGE
jgi:DNA-binding NarL/FixJ family response regulator